MKKIVILCFFCFNFIPCVFSQEKQFEISNKTETLKWGEMSLGASRIITPLFADAEGNGYGGGNFSTGLNLVSMYSLSKSPFSIGCSFRYNQLDTRLLESKIIDERKSKLFPMRFIVGPAVGITKGFNNGSAVYIVASIGIKWDTQYKKFLSPFYYYCQNSTSVAGSLSGSYVFLKKKEIGTFGIKGSLFSYGNSREARSAHIKDPLIDGFEVALCWYLTRRTPQ